MSENSNPLLTESQAPFGAPEFDKIDLSHYMPAFKQSIEMTKKEVDAIASNEDLPTFENTIEALEYAGRTLSRVEGIFFNLLEAESKQTLQNLAEQVSPLLTELSIYINHNDKLFSRIKEVYSKRESLSLEPDQLKLLEDTFNGFVRGGADLPLDKKEEFGKLSEELSLLTLKFSNNVLAATHAWTLHLQDEKDLEGLPEYVKEIGASAAKEKDLPGWVFTLDYPSYSPFMKFSSRRDLRKKMYVAYNSKCLLSDNDNTEIIRQIASKRLRKANILGYKNFSDYALEDRMAAKTSTVLSFLDKLMEPSLPKARKEVAMVLDYARKHGFEEDVLQAWDFSYWAEKLQKEEYSLSEELLKPYFKLENVIDAVFSLAGKLYRITFQQRTDIPVYHKDVKVYDVRDENSCHLALFYADFFPREGKRGGAWMTEFEGQFTQNGEDHRPFISIVTNFTKPTEASPSLLTHNELTTFLHEFGHSLHGILSKGRYPSLSGTNVARDFVELPSQIMENWAFEPEYLETFARDYRTGESLPKELIDRIVAAKNYLSAYYQVRQLRFGIVDMAWHTIESLPEESTVEFENKVLSKYDVFPKVEGCATCPSFGHIFSGGYAAGYYSYKWAEVLEADAFAVFQKEGIFNREVAGRFRKEILEKGSSSKEDVLYRNFAGHDPQPEALLRKLGIID